MSSRSPSLLVVGLLLSAARGILTARTVKWIFRKFPETFRPSSPTAITPLTQQDTHHGNGITKHNRSKQELTRHVVAQPQS